MINIKAIEGIANMTAIGGINEIDSGPFELLTKCRIIGRWSGE
jgi:hypothetical protein